MQLKQEPEILDIPFYLTVLYSTYNVFIIRVEDMNIDTCNV